MIRQVGTLVQLETVIRDASGTPVNTPTVTLSVTKPDGSTLTPDPSVTNTGANGAYTATVTPDQAGLWLYTWTASGTVTAVQGDQFSVVAQQRALVASLEEFKKHLNRSDVGDDDELRTHLVAATDVVEGLIGGPLAVTELTERVQMSSRWIIPSKRPLVSVTSITPDLSGPLDSSLYVVDTDRSAIRLLYGWDYTHSWGISRGWCTVVYKAGLSIVSERTKLAGLIQAAHLWETQNGMAGRRPTDEYVPTGLGYAVPNRVKELLSRDNLPGIG